jgi:hypothetical protein
LHGAAVPLLQEAEDLLRHLFQEHFVWPRRAVARDVVPGRNVSLPLTIFFPLPTVPEKPCADGAVR